MRVLYLDCFSGISGDMLIGALLDAGLNFNEFKKQLNKLGLGLKNVRLEKKKVRRGALVGTKFSVVVKKDANSRMFADIQSIVEKSTLDRSVKEISLQIFKNLTHSEARSHGYSLNTTHLHEVGRIDSIVDIVGAAIALRQLKIDRVYSSIVHLGKGRTKISHGIIPVPVPAVLNLLKGKEIEVRFTNVKKELVTPTGAAILRTLAAGSGEIPDMKILRVGYGAGSCDLKERPNLLRIVIGESSPYLKDIVCVLETNIDDMNPQFFDSLCQKLFKAGALDVYLTPVMMKKYRPGILLTVLCKENLVPKISSIIFSETTSTGVRFYKVRRNKLNRIIQNIQTKYGKMRAKICFAPGLLKVYPEYDDCRKTARKRNIPLKRVYEEFCNTINN